MSGQARTRSRCPAAGDAAPRQLMGSIAPAPLLIGPLVACNWAARALGLPPMLIDARASFVVLRGLCRSRLLAFPRNLLGACCACKCPCELTKRAISPSATACGNFCRRRLLRHARAAEAAAARQPAAAQSGAAHEWVQAAKAWGSALEALETARQADPDGAAVRAARRQCRRRGASGASGAACTSLSEACHSYLSPVPVP